MIHPCHDMQSRNITLFSQKLGKIPKGHGHDLYKGSMQEDLTPQCVDLVYKGC